MEARDPLYPDRQRGFAATCWTVIRACARNDTVASGAREQLCCDYWYPVYAHLRRLGHQSCDAEDFTQEFFAHVLSRPWFARVDESQGKFRSFLLTSLNRFVQNHLDRRSAFKRGGRHVHVPLEISGAESRYTISQAGQGDATSVYEVEWAATVVATVLQRLADEYSAGGRPNHHQALKQFLTMDGDHAQYVAAAQKLETTVQNIKVCVHRIRKRYGLLLREEVARTVSSPGDVDDEMRHLRRVLVAVGD